MTTHHESSSKIKQIEEEIKELKEKLKKPHLTHSNEQDYDIKSHIIDKQNEMIELLMQQSKKAGH
jgi:hypothetical protein